MKGNADLRESVKRNRAHRVNGHGDILFCAHILCQMVLTWEFGSSFHSSYYPPLSYLPNTKHQTTNTTTVMVKTVPNILARSAGNWI